MDPNYVLNKISTILNNNNQSVKLLGLIKKLVFIIYLNNNKLT